MSIIGKRRPKFRVSKNGRPGIVRGTYLENIFSTTDDFEISSFADFPRLATRIFDQGVACVRTWSGGPLIMLEALVPLNPAARALQKAGLAAQALLRAR